MDSDCNSKLNLHEDTFQYLYVGFFMSREKTEVMIKIQKIINNNVIQFIDDNGKEVIAMGILIGLKIPTNKKKQLL